MLYTRTDETIRNTAVIVDRQRFVRCTFIDCQLIYMGEGEVDFDDCTFRKCEWTFDEAASRTMGYLSTLAHKVGPDGEKIVREIVDGIFDGRVTKARDVSLSATVTAKADITADLTVEKHAVAS